MIFGICIVFHMMVIRVDCLCKIRKILAVKLLMICHDTSGGYHVKTDIWSYHNYEQDAAKLKERLTIKKEGEVPTLNIEREAKYSGQPYLLDEYGGIKWVVGKQYAANTWGYGTGPKSVDEFYTRLEALTDTLLSFDYMSGYTYTQLTDVEQEQNGLLTYNREFKFAPEKYHRIFSKQAKIEK